MTSATTSASISIPLVEELRPAPSAWAVARNMADRPHLLFLDSALSQSPLGRYSFVAADPFSWMQARQGQVFVDGIVQPENDPFAVLKRLLARFRLDRIPELPPFQGGAAGLFGYDLCHHIERLPRPHNDEFETPDLALGFYDCVVAFDHVQGRAWLISTGFPEVDASRRRLRAQERLDDLRRALAGPSCVSRENTAPPICPVVHYPLSAVPGLWSNFDRPGFLEAIARAIEYIHAGDCFQVNLSQRLLHPATVPPLELYRRLRERNPAPFAGFFDLGEFIVASASPERFVRVVEAHVETRPIKGTRPRGATPAEDTAQAAELLASQKDRAENVMIIDLLRNDLGRVCAYGSVSVDAVCRLETYQTVHHLVSEVSGQLRPGLGPIDLLRAAFPGGSVTGAPKVRAMQIIAELEPTARGPYCGCLGYIGFDGSMDTSILIRTFMIGKGWIQFPVGGGIVADSTPEGEYLETLHKADGLVRALQP
jgi:para-aminobenzoate synthetase component 1